jgi:hypothetical protein
MPQLQLCLMFFTNNSNSQELENLDVTTPYKHVYQKILKKKS